MTPEEWKQRCAARYVAIAGLTQEQADMAAKATFEAQDGEFSRIENYSPEDCADSDLEHWEHDGQ